MIANGKVSFLALAALLVSTDAALPAAVDDANSAVIAARNGDYDRAIERFTSAINSDELSLKSRAQAYAYRGIAKATTSDYPGAQEDLNSAVVLDSEYNGDAYAFRGYFKLVMGQPKEGAADLARSSDFLIWPYNVAWLYLSRLKAGLPDTDDKSLAANVTKLDARKSEQVSSEQYLAAWPRPMLKFLMGGMTANELTAAAQPGDPMRLAERVCDADFYAAEIDLAHGDANAAKPRLQRAAEKCPFASFERMGATAELMRLK
jgi:lipoprotein NlpI